MKKSQLRKIIRESIKGLLTEQVSNSHQTFDMEICSCQDPSGAPCPSFPMYQIGYIGPYNTNQGFTCNGLMCNPNPNGPDIGSVFDMDHGSVTLTFKLLAAYNPGNATTFFNLTNSSCPNAAVTYDCDMINGCYNPGTGNGQYVTLSGCQQQCTVTTPSWDCNNGVCNDPGTGLGQYITLSACQQNCVTPSWDCNNGVCSDPGTGNGQYSTITACQQNCSVSGCTDPQAINYDPNSTIDDGSCYGCMDTLSINYCPLCNADCQNTVGGTDTGCCTLPDTYDCDANYNCVIPGWGIGAYNGGTSAQNLQACQTNCIQPADTYDCDQNYNCVWNAMGTGTYSGGTSAQNLQDCQTNCTYNIGCADPTAAPCSSQPGPLQNNPQCYDPNHGGCDDWCNGCGIPDPNDTSCCLFEAWNIEPLNPDNPYSLNSPLKCTCCAGNTGGGLSPTPLIQTYTPGGCSSWNGPFGTTNLWGCVEASTFNITDCQMLDCSCCDNGNPASMQPIAASTPGGCSSWNGTPGTGTNPAGIAIPLTDCEDNTTFNPNNCYDCTTYNFAGSPSPGIVDAYNLGLANNQAYGVLDGNSLLCVEYCGMAGGTNWYCDCCGPIHDCDTSDVAYGCWTCQDDQSCTQPSTSWIAANSTLNYYNDQTSCLTSAPTNCPPPPPTPRNLPGSKERLQELANIIK